MGRREEGEDIPLFCPGCPPCNPSVEEINIKKKKKDRNPNTEKKTESASQGLEVSQSLKTRAQSLGLGWGELVALVTLSSKATLWTLPYMWTGQEWHLDRGKTSKGAVRVQNLSGSSSQHRERETLNVEPGGPTPEKRRPLCHPLGDRTTRQGFYKACGEQSFP